MEKYTRSVKIDRTKIDKKNRKISATLSTEYPVQRNYGTEILVHEENSIDLSRAPIPLIVSHDAEELPIGLVENIQLVGKKLKGILRFGNGSKASEIWEDVKSGILQNLSIAYAIHERQTEGDIMRATRWELLETSIVSVPADPGARIGRSYQKNNKGYTMNLDTRFNELYSKIKRLLERDDAGSLSDEEANELFSCQREFDGLAPAVMGVNYRTYALHGREGVEKKLNRTSNGPVPGQSSFTMPEDDSKFRSLGSQLMSIRSAGMPGAVVDDRLLEINQRATGLNESVDSEGGFLLQQEINTSLLSSINQTGKLVKFCKRLTLTGNSIDLPIIDETSRVTGSRWGNLRGYWISEAGEKIASKPKFGKLTLKPKKQVVLVYATDELLADVSVLDQVISDGASEEFGFMSDDGILNGTGSGQMLGVMNSSCLITQDKEAGQAANSVVYENVIKAWSRLWPIGHATAVWLVHPTVLPQLYTMTLAVGTGGSTVYMPGGGASASPYATLFNRPVIPCEQCAAVGTAGDIILADLQNGYIIAEKGDVQKDISMHVRFIYDESIFRFVKRIDGQPLINSAITPYKGSDTTGPFVCLQTRD